MLRLTFHVWLYGVAVSTRDSESRDPSSNLGTTSFAIYFLFELILNSLCSLYSCSPWGHGCDGIVDRLCHILGLVPFCREYQQYFFWDLSVKHITLSETLLDDVWRTDDDCSSCMSGYTDATVDDLSKSGWHPHLHCTRITLTLQSHYTYIALTLHSCDSCMVLEIK